MVSDNNNFSLKIKDILNDNINNNLFKYIKEKTINILDDYISSIIFNNNSNKDINIILTQDIFDDNAIKEIFFKLLCSKFTKTSKNVNIIIKNHITNYCDFCETCLCYSYNKFKKHKKSKLHKKHIKQKKQMEDLKRLFDSIDTNLKYCSIRNHFYKLEYKHIDFCEIFYKNNCIIYLDLTNCEITIRCLTNLLKNLFNDLLYLNISTNHNFYDEVSNSIINRHYSNFSMFYYVDLKEIVSYFNNPIHDNLLDYINELISFIQNKSYESSDSSDSPDSSDSSDSSYSSFYSNYSDYYKKYENYENLNIVVELLKKDKLQTLNIEYRKDFSTILHYLIIGLYFSKSFNNLVVNLEDLSKEDYFELRNNVKFITDSDNYNYLNQMDFFKVSTDILDKNILIKLLYDKIISDKSFIISDKFFNEYYFDIIINLLSNKSFELENLKLDCLIINYDTIHAKFLTCICYTHYKNLSIKATKKYINTIEYDLIELYKQIFSRKALLKNIKYRFVANKTVNIYFNYYFSKVEDCKILKYYCEANNIIYSLNLLISIIGELNNNILYIDISNNLISKEFQWIRLCKYLRNKTNLNYLNLSDNFMDCSYKYLVVALITTNSNSKKLNILKRNSLKILKLPQFYIYTKYINNKEDSYKIQEEINVRKIILRNLKNLENINDFIQIKYGSNLTENYLYDIENMYLKTFSKYLKKKIFYLNESQ